MADLRLAVVAPNFPPRIGGIESFLHSLLSHAWPATTTVFAPPTPGAVEWDSSAPFAVNRLALTGRIPPRWLRSCRTAREIRTGYDAVVFSEWWPTARAAAAIDAFRPFQNRRPVGPLRALVVYGTDIVAAEGRALRSLRSAVAAMDVVISISEFTREQLQSKVPRCPEVHVLNPGVDLDPPRAEQRGLRERFGLGSGPIVLTAARLVERKGHVQFARHWPSVESRVPGAQWVVVGDGPCLGELRRLATPSIRILGEVDRPTLMALFAMADVHLLPAIPAREVEGFGMVINEAGAAGTPSLAADLGGTAEAMGDGGLVVPGGDMQAMATAVAELLSDDARRVLLGQRARARAMELQWDIVAGKFRQMITDALGVLRP